MAAPSIHALVGPTASGKESAAVPLALEAGAEILALDSMKLYRGLDIGTATASAAHRASVPHHLLDLADPTESFSTRCWLTTAESVLQDVLSRKRRPLFVGGTALYLKALLYGLFEGPPANEDIRRRLRALSCETLHDRLRHVDPPTAAKVHPHDRRRLIRALEVHDITGRPISELRRQWDRSPSRAFTLVGIRRDRSDLYSRIDRRVDRMVDAGLVDEVAALLAAPGGLGPIARQALGYKEIAAFLEGDLPSLEEALRLLRSRTRSFARRQLTWFKHFPIEWIDVGPDEKPSAFALRAASALGW